MRKCLGMAIFVLAVCVGGAGRGHAGEFQLLTGMTRYACEALICLSTGVVPGECGPGLAVYYSINGATPVETEILRKAFLMTCPTGGSVGLQRRGGGGAMDEAEKTAFIDVIVKGEGGVNVVQTPEVYVDASGKEYPPNWFTIDDTAAGAAYRAHPNVSNIPDDRGLYIDGQKAETRNGKVYLNGVEYRMNQQRRYAPVN